MKRVYTRYLYKICCPNHDYYADDVEDTNRQRGYERIKLCVEAHLNSFPDCSPDKLTIKIYGQRPGVRPHDLIEVRRWDNKIKNWFVFRASGDGVANDQANDSEPPVVLTDVYIDAIMEDMEQTLIAYALGLSDVKQVLEKYRGRRLV